jgi:hypothetical protein
VKLGLNSFYTEKILWTFLPKHNWSVGMHGNYLYTIPLHFDKLRDFIDFGHPQSNHLEMLNSSRI